MKHHHSPGWLLVAALLLATLSGLPASLQAQYGKVDPLVWHALHTSESADVLVVLDSKAALSAVATLPTQEAKGRFVHETLLAASQKSQQGLVAMLDALQADYQSFYIVNALRVRVDTQLIQALAERPEVVRILPNPRIAAVPWSPPSAGPDPGPGDRFGTTPPKDGAASAIEPNLIRISANDVWALGYTGQGIVVAGQDTGYDWDHPALKRQYRGWNGSEVDHDYNWHDAIHTGGGLCGPDSPEPCDDHNSSHGTHTMGIIVGDDGASHQIGVAPDAQWIGCRNMDEGFGTPATYIECFEFFLAPYPVSGTMAEGNPSLAPQVVNNSWTCPPEEGCTLELTALLEGAVQALRQAGIVVVASAGNYGSGCGSIRYPPAIFPQSLSVGNFDHRTDQIAGSSSRGPVTYDGLVYTGPDITAPGVGIYSSIRDGFYRALTGTSMSAPHVAGSVALLLSAAPGISGQVDAIEAVLASTAQPMTTTQACGGDGPDEVPNNTWGWGIVDAFAAVAHSTAGTLHGEVREAESSLPIAGATMAASLAIEPSLEFSALSTASGFYTITLPAGVYRVQAQASGYVSQTVTGVPVISTTMTRLDFPLAPLVRFYLPLVSSTLQR
jgi:subtilisin family serine protease